MLHYDGKLYIGVKLGVVCCCLLDKARRTKSLPFSRVRDFFHFLARNAPYKNTCVTSMTGSYVEVGSVYESRRARRIVCSARTIGSRIVPPFNGDD